MSRAQIIKCKCGKVFAAAVVPMCYTDKDWMKDLRKYVLEGCSVEIVDTGKFEFEKCTCNDEKEDTKKEHPNQMKLFNITENKTMNDEAMARGCGSRHL